MTQHSNGNAQNDAEKAENQNSSETFQNTSEQDSVIKMEEAEATLNGSTSAPVDQAAEWKNKAAYLSAEIENMRKRFAREKLNDLKFANEEVIKKFLPVLDCLELALKAAKDSETKLDPALRDSAFFVSLMKGLDMTLKVFEQTLESAGCSALKSVGENFDPSQHEALGQSQNPDLGDNVVSQVLQRGFSLSGRVIRTSKVMVNKVVN